MTVISLGKNIASLKAQRQLNDTSLSISRSFERLASGQRINGAVDDAAGLSISTKLNAHARVYGQALRNANDGISALNIAEGAVSQLSEVLIRIKELAESSANGVLGLKQRRSLHSEAKALTEEYNRILSTTSFNNNKLLDGSLNELSIQLGFGADGRLSFSTAGELSRNVGTGSYGSASASLGAALDTTAADLNGDGFDDLIMATPAGAQIRISNGDGTFQAAQTVSSGVSQIVMAGDLNGDGFTDIISGTTDSLKISLGRGDGTFSAETSYSMSGGSSLAAMGDLNGDGRADVALGNGSSIRVFMNNGNGTFGSGVQVLSSSNSFAGDLQIADFNSDSQADLLFTDHTSQTAYVTGNGDGSFGAARVLNTGYDSFRTALGDYNHDGHVDLLVSANTFSGSWSNWGGPHVLINNGDGSFRDAQTLSGSATGGGALAYDANGDGILDLTGTNGSNLVTWLGNGDGSFAAGIVSAASAVDLRAGSIGDFNGDGALDLIASAGGGVAYRHLAASEETSTVEHFNLTTREASLETLDLLNEYLARVSNELGSLGAAQSRLSSAVNTITQTRENYFAAYSRIMDIDVADETGRLLINQIRQQAATAIMAQANQAPALVLQLL